MIQLIFYPLLAVLSSIIMTCQPKTNASKDQEVSRIMVSSNEGKTWAALEKGLSHDIKINDFLPFQNKFYIATTKGLYQSDYIFPSPDWKQISDFKDHVSGLYDNQQSIVFSTRWYGLNEYSGKSEFVKKLIKNEPRESIRNFVRLSTKVWFYCSDYGLSKSEDGGLSWDKLKNLQGINALLKTENNMVVAGKYGIWLSDLNGDKFEQKLISDCPITTLLNTNGNLYAIGVYENQFMKMPNVVYESADQGKNWKKIEIPSAIGSVYHLLSSKKHYFLSTDIGVFRSKTLDGNWEKIISIELESNGYYALYSYENTLICIFLNNLC